MASETGLPLVVMDMGSNAPDGDGENASARRFRIFSVNDPGLFHEIVLLQEGEATQVKPVFLFHEGEDRYGFIHTLVDAEDQSLPLSSAITRFSWDPMSETPYAALSRVNWTPTGANSTIISGADTQTDLILVATRQDDASLQKPLMVVRLAKAILSDEPEAFEFTDTFDGITASGVGLVGGYQITALIQGDGSNDITGNRDALTGKGAKVTEPLSFRPNVETRLAR